MPTISDPRKLDYANPVTFYQVGTIANNTAQFDLSINPPSADYGIVISHISFQITDTGLTTLTLAYDGVDQFTWTCGTGGTVANSALYTLTGDLFATAKNQTVRLRTSIQGTSRTVTKVIMTGRAIAL